jgi:hypothetical protein
MHRGTKAALASAALVLVFGTSSGCSKRERSPAQELQNSAPPIASTPVAAPETIPDPLAPDRPLRVDPEPRADAGNWVSARPGFQNSRTPAERGGIEPCASQPVDTSGFDEWAPVAQGKFTAPRELVLDEDGGFDLVIHLLGDEPIRRELINSRQAFVLHSITVSSSQSYAPLFTGTQLQAAIVSGVEQALSKRFGRPAHKRHLAMSAWSAGFVGIEAALAQPWAKDIDAVILIDGLHAPRGNEPAFKAQMKPFLDFAALAARGERSFLVSHSSIDPPDFASTSECAHYLIASLGGRPRPVRRSDRFGLELVEFFSAGDFQVRGYAGNDRADHCAQLAVLRDAFAALGKRWRRTPSR